ncbi:hypothetical protein C5C33_06030 [Rathayibacter sp. AY1H3]|nr:hypothetical protein C5C33_06030 [Rathayibacter sp. AY1H3]
MNDQLLDLLRAHDAEPRTPLTAGEAARRDALLGEILVSADAAAPRFSAPATGPSPARRPCSWPPQPPPR